MIIFMCISNLLKNGEKLRAKQKQVHPWPKSETEFATPPWEARPYAILLVLWGKGLRVWNPRATFPDKLDPGLKCERVKKELWLFFLFLFGDLA